MTNPPPHLIRFARLTILVYLLFTLFSCSPFATLSSPSFSSGTTENVDGQWWDVITYGTIYSKVLVQGLSDDTLIVLENGQSREIPVDRISRLIYYRPGKFWDGAAVGAGVGAMLGALIGYTTYSPSTGSQGFDTGPGVPLVGGLLVGCSSGFLLGGAIAAGASTDKVYDLSAKTTDEKMQVLSSAFAQ